MAFEAAGAEKAKSGSSKKVQFKPSKQVKDLLVPLFSKIAKADVSRARVELSAETVMGGEVVGSEQSTYQIASKYPDQYTIYHKGADDRKRIYASKKNSTVAMAPDKYFKLPEVVGSQDLVKSAPINLGPYPEPLLALTLAGVDPGQSFFGGMESIEILGREKFRGRTDSIHLHGRQDDKVTWEFWVTDEKEPRPLRLLVNLTPMLIATGQVRVPDGYAFSLRYDFQSWRMTGEVDDNLFEFVPPEDSTEFKSLNDYRQKMATRLDRHPMLGKKAPAYVLDLLDGTKIRSKDLSDKIVVLDFWATWCQPCLQAMPVIRESVAKYKEKDVVFYAINVAENPDHVGGFVNEFDWGIDVAVDPDGELMEKFSAGSIPLTLIIAPSGIVEAAHIGFPGKKELASQFNDELDVLVEGGRIASSKTESDSSDSSQRKK